MDPSDIEVEDKSELESEENEEEGEGYGEGEDGEGEGESEDELSAEGQEAIDNAQIRLDNYILAIEYCKKFNLSSENVDDFMAKKKEIDKTLKKMKKSKEPRQLSIYLPNEVSPEMLFGNNNVELNKEKADLLSSVNKSVSEHQKMLIKLDSADFKTKSEKKQMEDKIKAQITRMEDIKKKLEVIQKNRWWPLPQFSNHTESYFIPLPGKKAEEGDTE